MINVKDFGALGNGTHDDTAAINAALASGQRDICIPAGTYVISDTLLVPSHRHIHADAAARLVLIPTAPMVQEQFLVSNADPLHGNEDIVLEGGIWDGGFGHEYNVKNPDIFARNANSGACINFVGVKDLKLLSLVVANSIVYHIRLSRVENFEVRDIGFSAEKLSWNQDGVHLGGDCRNGVIENIRALTRGETNDDLIALNADDSTQRLENRGLTCGPIENIVIRNVYAEDCHTAIRMLSIGAPIRHITFENITAGCRCYAINMDGARYCRTPLFVEAGAFDGVGCIEDVHIRNMTAWYSTEKTTEALICAESNADDFTVDGFTRDLALDKCPEKPTFLARNLTHERVTIDGAASELSAKEQTLTAQSLAQLRMDYTR